jgi:Uma2 family endonuclease
VELLEGLIVQKMTKNPRHDATIDQLLQLLAAQLPAGWFARAQNVLITEDSAPEPDVVVTRGKPFDYRDRHPRASEVAAVIEVAESSLSRDLEKRRIYARAGVTTYWIVDLNSDRLEVYTAPDKAVGHFGGHERLEPPASVSLALPSGEVIALHLQEILGLAGS